MSKITSKAFDLAPSLISTASLLPNLTVPLLSLCGMKGDLVTLSLTYDFMNNENYGFGKNIVPNLPMILNIHETDARVLKFNGSSYPIRGNMSNNNGYMYLNNLELHIEGDTDYIYIQTRDGTMYAIASWNGLLDNIKFTNNENVTFRYTGSHLRKIETKDSNISIETPKNDADPVKIIKDGMHLFTSQKNTTWWSVDKKESESKNKRLMRAEFESSGDPNNFILLKKIFTESNDEYTIHYSNNTISPPGNKTPSMPYVERLSKKNGLNITFEPIGDKTYLGTGLPSFTFDSRKDSLYEYEGSYAYKTSMNDGRTTKTMTFNKFHLPIKVETKINGSDAEEIVTTYYMVGNEKWDALKANAKLPRQTTKKIFNSGGGVHTETLNFDFGSDDLNLKKKSKFINGTKISETLLEYDSDSSIVNWVKTLLSSKTEDSFDKKGVLEHENKEIFKYKTFDKNSFPLLLKHESYKGKHLTSEKNIVSYDEFSRVVSFNESTYAYDEVSKVDVYYTYEKNGGMLTTTKQEKHNENESFYESEVHEISSSNLIKKISSRGQTVEFEYDPYGIVTKEIYNKGKRFSNEISYDLSEYPGIIYVTSTRDTPEEHHFNESNKKTKEISSGVVKQLSYDQFGDLISERTTIESGDYNVDYFKSFSHNLLERTTTITSSNSSVIEIQKSDPPSKEKIIEQTSGDRSYPSFYKKTVTTYNDYGFVEKQSDFLLGDTTSISDSIGLVKEIKNHNNRVDRMAYDDLLNLKEKSSGSNVINYENSLFGIKSIKINDKIIGERSYDHLGRLISEVVNGEYATRYTYASSDFFQDKPSSMTNGNGTINYHYHPDDNSLLIQETGDNTIITYEHDENKNIINTTRVYANTREVVVVNYIYDAYHNLVSKTTVINGDNEKGQTETYNKTPSGVLLEKKELNGNTYTYKYNKNGELTNKTIVDSNDQSHNTTYSYNSSGQLIEESNTKGIKTNYFYSREGFLIETYTISGDFDIYQETLSYDKDIIIKKSEGYIGSNTSTVEYDYDSFGRIKKATYQRNSNGGSTAYVLSEEFIYDKFNNCTSKTAKYSNDKIKTTTFSYSGVKLTAVNGEKIEYDACGNIIKDNNGILYEFDAYNRITQATDTNKSITSSYLYDSTGTLVRQSINGSGEFIDFSYDGFSISKLSSLTNTKLIAFDTGTTMVFDNKKGVEKIYQNNHNQSSVVDINIDNISQSNIIRHTAFGDIDL